MDRRRRDNRLRNGRNWDLDRVPAETDDVVIDGAAVTVNGNYRIPASLTLQNGGSWGIRGEIQSGKSGVENRRS